MNGLKDRLVKAENADAAIYIDEVNTKSFSSEESRFWTMIDQLQSLTMV